MALELPKLDYRLVKSGIVEWIRRTVAATGREGVVLGLSGGVDSAVVAALAAEALGGNRVKALIMPTSFTPQRDVEDALSLAETLRLNRELIPLDEVLEAYGKRLKPDADKVAKGNLIARVRMNIAYYYANMLRSLVVGAGDRSEYLIGFFTKFGDGAADLYPILHLYKTQVRELCRYMKLGETLCGKPSSPMLWPGHKAVDELPVDYPILDRILYGLYDLGLDGRRVAEELGVDIALVEEVERRHSSTQHKRIIGYVLPQTSL